MIPGYIAAYRYAMADYILFTEPGTGIMDALRRSKQRMRGRKWSLFCLNLSFIGWAFLCILPGTVLVYYGTTWFASVLGAALVWAFMCIIMPYRNAAQLAFFRHDPQAEAAKETLPLIEEEKSE